MGSYITRWKAETNLHVREIYNRPLTESNCSNPHSLFLFGTQTQQRTMDMLYSAFRLSIVEREAVKQCGRHMLKAKANLKVIHEVRKTVEDPTKGKYVLLLYRNR